MWAGVGGRVVGGKRGAGSSRCPVLHGSGFGGRQVGVGAECGEWWRWWNGGVVMVVVVVVVVVLGWVVFAVKAQAIGAPACSCQDQVQSDR